MFAKVLIFCAALAAVHGSVLLTTPLVNTGVSVESRQQDAFGNYAYAYDIKDGATGSINSKAEVGRAVAVAAPVISAPLAYAAPAVAASLAYAAPAVVAPGAYGGVLGHAGVLGFGYGVGVGHGAPLGLGYGAGILAAGHSKVLL
ncbi:adult-specific rigid cuticular protein 15.5-like [Argiope bruennichi]|uniref:Adult-specific rigid cuticular protein 15.7 like protein n=1 Tax=Argiope bruennichi TaxID=94029 RepID=A0A8T0FDX7_ARGBR|nr:adult-specific rigid cuticular protein 15.5-like [Argiope bruennichi]KAF8787619.1 Adult-specific rigid cuticular protein 15.7 like protein [Argiope bruennichi]